MPSKAAGVEMDDPSVRACAADGTVDISLVLAAHLHEIKNDLFFVLGALDKAASQCADPLISTAQLAGAGLNQKLMRLLTLYRLARGQHTLQRDLWPVFELLEDVRAECGTLASARAIEISVHVDADLRHVLDRELVTSAVTNAVHNAMRFARSSVRLLAMKNRAGLIIRVIDDGPGPALAPIEARGSAHTGLGMYFCQEIAAAHQCDARRGTVSLETGLNRGAVWTLCLP